MNGTGDIGISRCGLFIYGMFSYGFNRLRSECLYLCQTPGIVQCMAFGWWNFQNVCMGRVTNAETVLCLV
jgi:hypothetical protein